MYLRPIKRNKIGETLVMRNMTGKTYDPQSHASAVEKGMTRI